MLTHWNRGGSSACLERVQVGGKEEIYVFSASSGETALATRVISRLPPAEANLDYTNEGCNGSDRLFGLGDLKVPTLTGP